MLGAAFAAAAVAAVTGSRLARRCCAGIAFGVGLALVHGFASITHRGNQVVSGVAINFIAAGLGPSLGRRLVPPGRAARRCTAPGARFAPIDLPFAEALRDVPSSGRSMPS